MFSGPVNSVVRQEVELPQAVQGHQGQLGGNDVLIDGIPKFGHSLSVLDVPDAEQGLLLQNLLPAELRQEGRGEGKVQGGDVPLENELVVEEGAGGAKLLKAGDVQEDQETLKDSEGKLLESIWQSFNTTSTKLSIFLQFL